MVNSIGTAVKGGSGGAAAVSWMGYDGSKDGSPISLGTGTTGTTRPIDVAVLSSSRAIVSFSNNANSEFATVALLNISGTEPVLMGSLLVINSANTQAPRITAIDSRYAAIMYVESGAKGQIVDKDAGGTDIIGTVGSQQDLSGNISMPNSGDCDIDLFDSTHIIAVYKDNASSDLFGSVITVNTTTGAMTDNTPATLFSGTLDPNRAVHVNMFSSTQFAASIVDTTPRGVIAMGSLSGTTVTPLADSSGDSDIATIYPILPWVLDDESIVGAGVIHTGDTRLPSYFKVNDWNGSSLSQNRACAPGGTNTAMYKMETVDGDEYFLGISRSALVTSNGDYILRGGSYGGTTNVMSLSETPVDINIVGHNQAPNIYFANIVPIDGTKAIIIARNNSDGIVKAYIANQ